MVEIVYAPRFAKELARVTSPKVEAKIYNALSLIERTPTLGSRKIPERIKAEFGPGVLKMVVDPFDIFYEYFEEADTVFVYTLVFQRQAR